MSQLNSFKFYSFKDEHSHWTIISNFLSGGIGIGIGLIIGSYVGLL